MTEEIIPNDGRRIDINSPTAKNIIDGVVVSGCRFLDEYEHCGICKELCEGHCLILQDIECKTYEDCHYRQLKRLEQKLEKIKEICKEAIRLCDCADADVNYDCIDCTDGGRASLAKEIMEVLKDE